MSTVPHNVPCAYYASLDGLSGIIVRPETDVLFLRDTGEVHTLTSTELTHLVVLGEVATAMLQSITDAVHGSAAGICTSRQNLEVR